MSHTREQQCQQSTQIALLGKRTSAIENHQRQEKTFRKEMFSFRDRYNVNDVKMNARIDVIEAKLDDVKVQLDTKIDSANKKLENIMAWIDLQKAKPAKRWDSLVEKILHTIIIGLIGFLLGYFGL